MESSTEIIIAIALVGVGLAALILTTSGRLGARLNALGTRLTAVEKETARLAGLLEGLGLSGRARGDRIEPAE